MGEIWRADTWEMGDAGDKETVAVYWGVGGGGGGWVEEVVVGKTRPPNQ